MLALAILSLYCRESNPQEESLREEKKMTLDRKNSTGNHRV